jgi:hypothetical protein
LRPPDTLPDTTQTGRGTLGMKINGQNWVYWIPPFALTGETHAFVFEGIGGGYMKARIWRDTLADGYIVYHDLGLSFSTNNSAPTQIVSTGFSRDKFNLWFQIGNQYKTYYPDTAKVSSTDYLYIDKLDMTDNIISGRFGMTLYVGNNFRIIDRSDSLVITDARFDFKYSEQ